MTCRFIRGFLCVIIKSMISWWHVSGGCGHPGGHARAPRPPHAPARWPVRDHGRDGGAVRLRGRRRRDAEHRAGGAAAAGVPGPGGRRGAGPVGGVCRDPAQRGEAGRVSSAGHAGPPRHAREGDRGAVGAGQGVAGPGCQRRGDRAAAGRGEYHGRPRPGAARAGAGRGRRGRPGAGGSPVQRA